MSKYVVLTMSGDADYNGNLSEAGILHVQSTAKKMSDAEIHPDLIWTSRSRRAKNTSKVLAESFGETGLTVSIKTTDYLEQGNIRNVLPMLDSKSTPVNTALIVSNDSFLYDSSDFLTGNPVVRPTQARNIECHINTWAEIKLSGLHRGVLDIQP